MRTEAKSKQHGGVALAFVTLLAVGCVQMETIPPQLEMHTNNNADAARFIEIINKQPSQLAIFNERMKGKHPFFEKTKLYTTADYGLSFFIPYGDGGTNIVTGAVYYPVQHETNANVSPWWNIHANKGKPPRYTTCHQLSRKKTE